MEPLMADRQGRRRLPGRLFAGTVAPGPSASTFHPSSRSCTPDPRSGPRSGCDSPPLGASHGHPRDAIPRRCRPSSPSIEDGAVAPPVRALACTAWSRWLRPPTARRAGGRDAGCLMGVGIRLRAVRPGDGAGGLVRVVSPSVASGGPSPWASSMAPLPLPGRHHETVSRVSRSSSRRRRSCFRSAG